MDGCDGAGDGDELVVGGDGMIADGGARLVQVDAGCARRPPAASVAGGSVGGTPRRARRSRRSPLAQHLGRLARRAAPLEQAAGGGRPARSRRSRPAAARGTGRPRRTARQSGVHEEGQAELQAGATDAVGHEVVRASCRRRRPGAARRRSARSCPAGARAGPAASTALSSSAEPVVGGEGGAADGHDVARPLGRDARRRRSRGCRGTTSGAGRCRSGRPRRRRPSRPRRAQRSCRCRRSRASGVERRRRAATRGRERRPGVGDDEACRRARTQAEHLVGLLLVEAIGQQQGDVVALRRAARPRARRRRRGSSRSDTSALVPSGPSDRGSSGGPSSGAPPSRRDREQPRADAPGDHGAPRREPLSDPAPPGPGRRARRSAPPRRRPVVAPPYQAASNSSVAAASERGGVRAGSTATSRTYSPAVRPACSGIDPSAHEIRDQRAVAAPQPLGPATLGLEALGLGSPLRGRAGQLHHHLGLGGVGRARERRPGRSGRAGTPRRRRRAAQDDPRQHRAPAAARRGVPRGLASWSPIHPMTRSGIDSGGRS